MIEDKSLDVLADKMAQLRELFPEVISEGKIDFKRLRDVLGDEVAFHNEHYELSWAGKSEARAEIQKTTSATLTPDESCVDAEGCGNIFIEGENLEVLHVLQRSYFGKVKMIYIDPPYNTGNDSFVYPDDYSERQSDYKKRAGITNEEGFLNKQDLWKKNTKESGQFHSVWLSMMYPRLYLARNLLREDGVIFISIDDNEQANLKLLCDEIFGAENFVASLIWEKGRKNDAKLFSSGHDYMLVYARSRAYLTDKKVRWREAKPGADEIQNEFLRLKVIHGDAIDKIQMGIREFYSTLPKNHPSKKLSRYSNVDTYGVWRDDNMSWPGGGGPNYSVIHPITNKACKVPDGGWRYSTIEKMQEMIASGRVQFREDHTQPPIRKTYLVDDENDEIDEVQEQANDIGIQVAGTYFYRSALQASNLMLNLFGTKVFDSPKDHEVIARWINYVSASKKDDIILDFFAGSGTTAHAVLALNEQDGGNRQFICVQLPEALEENSEAYKAGYRTIADICKARISKVIAKLQAEREAATQNTDLFADTAPKQPLGFNSFKIAPSNFKKWRSDAENQELLEQLDLFRHSEKQDSENKNLLVELLLKSGRPLTAKIETTTIDGQELYNVESGSLLLFFDAYNSQVKAFIFELKPKRVVCLDRVFKDDEALTNFQLNLKEAGIELQII